MTAPTSQTQNVAPVPSMVPPLTLKFGAIRFEAGGNQADFNNELNHTWMQWFVDLRTKVNTINANSVGWSGIPIVASTAGTYGDATHYPVVTLNANGLVTGITLQGFAGGGGRTAAQVLSAVSLGF